MAAADDDWRLLQGQEEYLSGVALHWQAYRVIRPEWDHDHCGFCWAKFMDRPGPDVLTEGYTTADEYHWICPDCFADFHERFQWTVEGE